MQYRIRLVILMAISLGLVVGAGMAAAADKSADEVAKELSNPAGSLASLSFNLQYTEFTGDLPGADNQKTTALTFQPVLPFPLGAKGRKIVVRPLLSLAFDQPGFNLATVDFEHEDPNLLDTTFDLVYAART